MAALRWPARLPCSKPLLSRAFCSSMEQAAPVVIVGAGPTGLTLSRLLSQLGVRSLLLDRAPALTTHPQAHFINNRTMEVFRQMRSGNDTLASRVAAASPPLADWRKFLYCESLTGNIFGEVDHFKGQDSARMPGVSPEPVAHLSQHRLLPLLLASATGPDACGSVRFGQEVTAITQSGAGLRIAVSDSQGETSEVACRFLVAADGANSRVRRALGVAMTGQAALQHLVNIHFSAPRLRARLAGREAMLYFVFSARVIAVLVAHDLRAGEFVAQVPYFPPTQSLADFPPEECARLLAAAIGDGGEAEELRIHSIRAWTMHAEVADRFKVGNVFLAGDAAHRFPPAGGFGMNTGIQDAHNLAWKLAAVLQGAASEALLGSYEAERRAIALANTALSVRNWEQALRVPAALGLDPAAARLLTAAVASRPASLLPQGLVKGALEAGLALGRAASGPRGPLRRWRERVLAEIFASGDTLRLQFPAEDLGFSYAAEPGAAVVRDEDLQQPDLAGASGHAAAGDTDPQQAKGQRRGLPYTPTTAPGARLPHCDVALLWAAGELGLDQQECRSTLDLVPSGSPHMLLVLGEGPIACAWAAAAMRLREAGHAINAVHVCGSNSTAQSLLEQSGRSSGICVALDTSGQWAQLREVEDSGAILVRPDGHVAWQCRAWTGVKSDVQSLQEELQSAMQQLGMQRAQGSAAAQAQKQLRNVETKDAALHAHQ